MAVAEGASAAAAVVSAVAAAVGAFVSLAQWKASRPAPPVRPAPPAPPPGNRVETRTISATASVEQPRVRSARWPVMTAALGSVSCGAFALTIVLNNAGQERDAVLMPFLLLNMVTGVVAVVMALPVIIIAFARSRWVDARAAAIGLVLALLPWTLLFIFGR